MKKLIIAAAMVCAASMVQAVSINWSSTVNAYGIDLNLVNGNGDYNAVTSGTNLRMKNCGTWAYTLALYDATTKDLVDSASGTMTFGNTGKIGTNGITLNTAKDGTTYNYIITITGAQSGLTTKTSDDWDYKNAMMSTKLTGSLETASTGDTSLSTGVPGTWSISGVTQKETPTPTPEPTSAMLLLIGVAGLALKRKQK